MLRLFDFLLTGCFHVWEDTGEGEYRETFGSTGIITYGRCKKCGEHTHWKNAMMKREKK